MNYSQVFPDLYLISLNQKMAGFRHFISSWLYLGEQANFLVDPGPKYSIEVLINVLEEIGVRKIDYVLLTHIHIDHAGGTGRLLELFPEAKVVCHPRGLEHLVDPARLWQGSLKVLGEMAESYGEIIPIPQEKFLFQERLPLADGQILVVETPGHAVHHLCFYYKKYLFAGEVAGVSLVLPGRIYARPATPPRFRLEKSLASLDKAASLKPDIICFGHYGWRKDAGEAMKTAREQLVLWTETVKEQFGKGEDNLDNRIIKVLLENDPVFANYKYLDKEVQKREDYFVLNAIKGMKEYVESAGLL